MMPSIAMLVLTACGSPKGPAADVSMQAGEWETRTEIVKVDAEGLPPGMAEKMAASMKSAGTTMRLCMTEEEARQPRGTLFTGTDTPDCKSEDFSWAGGRMKGKTTCVSGASGRTVMTMDGHYGAQDLDMTIRSEIDAGGRSIEMVMRLSGRRIGECSAATKKG
ncbi:MAG TPA: DUF3617 domain-containing protein [Allosphingosinicella sp.]|nr:DUF3617 domain-containing protein [Allosphingosinicella sp.]